VTSGTIPAGNQRPDGDPVADVNASDLWSRDDFSAELVTKHASGLDGEALAKAMQIRTADTARGDRNDSLPWRRYRLRALDEGEPFGGGPGGCPHRLRM
jgi:hypothetical protein